MASNAKSLVSIFDTTEYAILSTWLGVEPPIIARGIDIKSCLKPATADGPVRLSPDAWGNINGYSVSNAVARLVLTHVQSRLPQWGSIKPDGSVVLSRAPFGRTKRTVSILPQRLFEIDWGMASPGCSLPEAYYAGYLPYYDRYVVTVSRDSTSPFGYCDVAIGHFEARLTLRYQCKRLVLADWQSQISESKGGWEVETGEVFVEGGLFSPDEVAKWVKRLWPAQPDF